MNYRQAKQRAEILKALAHPVRILAVNTLQHGEQCVRDLNRLAKINQSNMSRHLACLKKAGIVTDRRDAMHVYYRLQTPCILKALDCASDAIAQETKRRVEQTK